MGTSGDPFLDHHPQRLGEHRSEHSRGEVIYGHPQTRREALGELGAVVVEVIERQRSQRRRVEHHP